jgi:flagellar L-ring protein precursor FlgH
MRFEPRLYCACLAGLFAGCAVVPPTDVQQPMSARAPLRARAQPLDGAIFNTGGGYRPLFEDRRARSVGDTLTVSIVEQTSASKKTSSKANRKSGSDHAVGAIVGLPGKSFQNAGLSADSDSSFEGGGASESNNDFTGTVTVTVVEVLSNGNLLVSGEKQIAINRGVEFIRLSGVVNPDTINGANRVDSTQIADARIEYKGNGYIDEAQTMGWLQRFFLTVLPF